MQDEEVELGHYLREFGVDRVAEVLLELFVYFGFEVLGVGLHCFLDFFDYLEGVVLVRLLVSDELERFTVKKFLDYLKEALGIKVQEFFQELLLSNQISDLIDMQLPLAVLQAAIRELPSL